eukprot:9464846-Alexandrium_andersonii.AAC.1
MAGCLPFTLCVRGSGLRTAISQCAFQGSGVICVASRTVLHALDLHAWFHSVRSPLWIQNPEITRSLQ